MLVSFVCRLSRLQGRSPPQCVTARSWVPVQLSWSMHLGGWHLQLSVLLRLQKFTSQCVWACSRLLCRFSDSAAFFACSFWLVCGSATATVVLTGLMGASGGYEVDRDAQCVL